MKEQLINEFMSATSTKEVDALVFKYFDVLDENPRLWSFPRNARKRLNQLRRIKLHLTEIIYLN